MFKISHSQIGTAGIRRRMLACMEEYLATVAEGVVHGVHKDVTWLSFRAIRQHKASGDKWMFHHCVKRLLLHLGWLLKDRAIVINACNHKLYRL